jgi:hypothetical protein
MNSNVRIHIYEFICYMNSFNTNIFPPLSIKVISMGTIAAAALPPRCPCRRRAATTANATLPPPPPPPLPSFSLLSLLLSLSPFLLPLPLLLLVDC